MATKAYVGAPGGIKAGTTADYIDTGYYLDPTVQTRIELVCTFENLSDTHSIMGTYYYGSGRDQENLILYHNAEGILWVVWWGNNFSTGINIKASKAYTIRFDLINGSQKMYVNNVEVASASYSGKIKNTNSFYLFAHNGTDKTANTSVYIKSCKIWENNTLIKNLEPYASSNIIKGLRDLVTGTTYQMSPSSILLQENIAREIKNMYVGVQDYVESNGTEVLPTTIISKVNQKVVLTMSFDEIPSDTNGFFFGNNFNGTLHAGIGVSNGKWCYTVGTATDARTVCTSDISPEINKKYLIEMYWGETSQYLKINGLLVRESSETAWTEVGSNKLRLFGYNNSPNLKVKIYGCAIYQNNTLVADYIPKGKTFYDNVSKTILPEIDTLKKGLDVAKRIFRGYVGVNNKARIFWDNSGFYNNYIENSLNERSFYTTISDNNYFLIAGGHLWGDTDTNSTTTLVEAYNSSFVYSTPTALGTKRMYLASAIVGDYFLFAGGETVGNGSSTTAAVNAYKRTTLTRSTPTSLSTSRTKLGGASIGNYALFAGGETSSAFSNIVNAYSTSLTRTTKIALSEKKVLMCSSSNDNYAIFSGGINADTYTNSVDAYSSDNLTHTLLSNLSTKDEQGISISSSNYAGDIWKTRWDFYNKSGVKFSVTPAEANSTIRGEKGVYFQNHYFINCERGTGKVLTMNNNFLIDGRVQNLNGNYKILDLLGDKVIGLQNDAGEDVKVGKIQ